MKKDMNSTFKAVFKKFMSGNDSSCLALRSVIIDYQSFENYDRFDQNIE